MDTNIVINGLVTLAAAFGGAWFAFLLEDRRRSRETKDKQVASGNRARFALVRQFNTLKNIQDQIIEPVRNHKGSAIVMRPTLPFSYDDYKIDLDSLSFLLETEHRQVLCDLFIEEERFKIAIQALNERSRLHLEVVQPLMSKAGIVEFKHQYGERDMDNCDAGWEDAGIDELKNALGEPVFLHIERATEQVLENIDSTVKSHLEMGTRLHDALKKLYPKYTIVGFGSK